MFSFIVVLLSTSSLNRHRPEAVPLDASKLEPTSLNFGWPTFIPACRENFFRPCKRATPMPSASQIKQAPKRTSPDRTAPNNKRRPTAKPRTCRRCPPRRTSHTRNLEEGFGDSPRSPDKGIRMVSSLPHSPNPTRERPVRPISRPECPPAQRRQPQHTEGHAGTPYSVIAAFAGALWRHHR